VNASVLMMLSECNLPLLILANGDVKAKNITGNIPVDPNPVSDILQLSYRYQPQWFIFALKER
jgi:hypothetical protein